VDRELFCEILREAAFVALSIILLPLGAGIIVYWLAVGVCNAVEKTGTYIHTMPY